MPTEFAEHLEPIKAKAGVRSNSPVTRWYQKNHEWFHAPIFSAMMGLLHLMLLEPEVGPVQRVLFVMHIGLFIFWQPVIERHREVSRNTAVLMGISIAVASFLLNAWVLVIWVVLLTGIVGGKVFLAGTRRLRLGYLGALAFLVLELLVVALPGAVPEVVVIDSVRFASQWGLPVLLAVVFGLSAGRTHKVDSEALDLINSLLLVLLVGILVLGTLASMLLFRLSYPAALVQCLFAMAAILFLMALLWPPHFGFSGLQSLFARYLSTIGLPAQEWLHVLARLTEQENDPRAFFAAACKDLMGRIVWIGGLEWTLSGDAKIAHAIGDTRGYRTRFSRLESEINVITRYPVPPSVEAHLNLLTHLLAEFYADKLRASKLRELSYLRAIHETGARLTHDVKNLLQSLQTLIYAAEHAGDQDPKEFSGLMCRQLPAISNRLSATLERLRAPAEGSSETRARFCDWWRELRDRYRAESWLQFECEEPECSTEIPEATFCCVLDNLIANGADKRTVQRGLLMQVRATVAPSGGTSEHGVVIVVSDNGEPLAQDKVDQLFSGPVASCTGLGVGLYQAARLASATGYALNLEKNAPGLVRFVLYPMTDHDRGGSQQSSAQPS